jgi:hypothetical protein
MNTIAELKICVVTLDAGDREHARAEHARAQDIVEIMDYEALVAWSGDATGKPRREAQSSLLLRG